MSSRYRNSDERGFTLLEVLIAMAVMVFISLGIYQMTTETYRLREVLSNEGDFYNSIRFSMEILQRDVALLYSPSVMMAPKTGPSPGVGSATGFPPPADAQDMQALMSSDVGQTTQFWLPATDKTGIRPSHFIGTDRKLSFISISHNRIYKDSPESDFAKISYELRKDEGNPSVPDAMVLVKVENSSAFENEDDKDSPFIRTYPLLHGITKFRYRYYYRKSPTDSDLTALTSWDNEKDDLKNLYPDIIEIELTVNGPSRLTFDGKYRFRPEVPLRGLAPST